MTKPPRLTKAGRWLNLLAYLVDHRAPVAREEIFTEVDDYKHDWKTGDDTVRESVRRKFERDKRELKTLGIVIEPGPDKIYSPASDQDVDGYRLKASELYLPYLELSGKAPAAGRVYGSLPSLSLKPQEFLTLRRAAERVQALGNSLGASAASAVRKLSFDIPQLDPGDSEVALAPGLGDKHHKIFDILRVGVETRRPVSCVYYTIGRDAESERTIEPYGLMLSWGTWYCVARAVEKEAIRVFRVSRMREARLLEQEPQFVVPDDFSVKSYLDRAPWELSTDPPVRARVRIRFPHSRWVQSEGLGKVVEPIDEEGGALLEFSVRTVEPFLRWLLPFGSQVEVLEPSDIRERLAAERDRLRALYR
jgi:predicted DNA-binding transcriptional regulator YafY